MAVTSAAKAASGRRPLPERSSAARPKSLCCPRRGPVQPSL